MGAEREGRGASAPGSAPEPPRLRNPNLAPPTLLEREGVRVRRVCGCPCGGRWELRVFCTGFLEMLTVIRASRGQRGGGTGRESPRLSFIWFEGVGRAVGGGRETRKKGGGGGGKNPPPTRTTQRHRAGITNSNSKKLPERIGERAEVRVGERRGDPNPARGSAGPGGSRGGDNGEPRGGGGDGGDCGAMRKVRAQQLYNRLFIKVINVKQI